jgi:hypothetical protein
MYNNELQVDYASKSTRFYNLIIDQFFFWIIYILHVFLLEDWIKMIVGEGSALKNIAYFYISYII